MIFIVFSMCFKICRIFQVVNSSDVQFTQYSSGEGAAHHRNLRHLKWRQLGGGETTVMREEDLAAQGETVMREEGDEHETAGETSDERGAAANPASAGQG